MGELLDGFVQGLPDEVSAKLLERAEGVPLYAVETVRMLVDRGVLVQHDGSYSVAGELGSLEIPETLQALIASRLDALPPEQRSLLQDAAVLGKTFPTEALAVVHGGDRANARGAICGTSSERSSSLSTPTPARPNEASTGSCRASSPRWPARRWRGGTAAPSTSPSPATLESLDDDELSGVVAAHYLEAHRAAPEGPEADEIAVGARDWLSRAGRACALARLSRAGGRASSNRLLK